jgi:hypothetical protein
MSRALTVVTVCLLVGWAGTRAQEEPADSLRLAAEQAPLFAAHDPIRLTLEAPFDEVFKERDEESTDHDAVLWYEDEGGQRVTLDVGVRTRGKFRLQRRVCGFPNLRLNFKQGQLENTLFAGQDKLKLVAHCQDKRDEYEQFTLQEYLIYRTFNLLTDQSFRVRLARITYIDTEGKRDSLTRYAFLIEDAEQLAARHGWQLLEVPVVPPYQEDQPSLTLFEVFQFMIGNTDWDPFSAVEGENCCHNAYLIGTMAGPVIPIPYDFDWSGVIDAPYARPDPMLGIRSVRQRRYWGVCRPPEEIGAVFPLFNDQRAAIYDMWQGQGDLEERKLRRTIEYFDEFYEIINDFGKANREMVRECRPVGE